MTLKVTNQQKRETGIEFNENDTLGKIVGKQKNFEIDRIKYETLIQKFTILINICS